MLKSSNNIESIKETILEEVAKLSFINELEDKADTIATELIPGPQANFRCCIYKEREIGRASCRERV